MKILDPEYWDEAADALLTLAAKTGSLARLALVFIMVGMFGVPMWVFVAERETLVNFAINRLSAKKERVTNLWVGKDVLPLELKSNIETELRSIMNKTGASRAAVWIYGKREVALVVQVHAPYAMDIPRAFYFLPTTLKPVSETARTHKAGECQIKDLKQEPEGTVGYAYRKATDADWWVTCPSPSGWFLALDFGLHSPPDYPQVEESMRANISAIDQAVEDHLRS